MGQDLMTSKLRDLAFINTDGSKCVAFQVRYTLIQTFVQDLIDSYKILKDLQEISRLLQVI